VSYRLRDHTADVAVEAAAESLGGVYATVADGMAAAMCDEIPDVGERFSFEERAESREALLYDYLDRLIYERDVRGVLPVDNRADVSEVGEQGKGTEWVVEAGARGVPLSEVHARDLKAVTYSEMRLEEREGSSASEASGSASDGQIESDGVSAERSEGEARRGAKRNDGVPVSNANRGSSREQSERDGGWFAYVVFDV
jgi:SHS2 domain-containing protein